MTDADWWACLCAAIAESPRSTAEQAERFAYALAEVLEERRRSSK